MAWTNVRYHYPRTSGSGHPTRAAGDGTWRRQRRRPRRSAALHRSRRHRSGHQARGRARGIVSGEVRAGTLPASHSPEKGVTVGCAHTRESLDLDRPNTPEDQSASAAVEQELARAPEPKNERGNGLDSACPRALEEQIQARSITSPGTSHDEAAPPEPCSPMGHATRSGSK